MTVLVLSFDYDGCLSRYPDEGENILHLNVHLLKKIQEESKDFSKVSALIGSLRQSMNSDTLNAHVNKNGSCFTAHQIICDYLGEKTSLDPFLMADIYGNLADGISYNRAISALSGSAGVEHALWALDKSKISILYAQMHRASLASPHEEILFDFYDDKDPILSELQDFFSSFPELIPHNLTLRLIQYAGMDRTLKTTIKGSGFTDKNYRETILEMAEFSFKAEDKDVYSNDESIRNISFKKYITSATLTKRSPPHLEEPDTATAHTLFPIPPRLLPASSGIFSLFSRTVFTAAETEVETMSPPV